MANRKHKHDESEEEAFSDEFDEDDEGEEEEEEDDDSEEEDLVEDLSSDSDDEMRQRMFSDESEDEDWQDDESMDDEEDDDDDELRLLLEEKAAAAAAAHHDRDGAQSPVSSISSIDSENWLDHMEEEEIDNLRSATKMTGLEDDQKSALFGSDSDSDSGALGFLVDDDPVMDTMIRNKISQNQYDFIRDMAKTVSAVSAAAASQKEQNGSGSSAQQKKKVPSSAAAAEAVHEHEHEHDASHHKKTGSKESRKPSAGAAAPISVGPLVVQPRSGTSPEKAYRQMSITSLLNQQKKRKRDEDDFDDGLFKALEHFSLPALNMPAVSDSVLAAFAKTFFSESDTSGQAQDAIERNKKKQKQDRPERASPVSPSQNSREYPKNSIARFFIRNSNGTPVKN